MGLLLEKRVTYFVIHHLNLFPRAGAYSVAVVFPPPPPQAAR